MNPHPEARPLLPGALREHAEEGALRRRGAVQVFETAEDVEARKAREERRPLCARRGEANHGAARGTLASCRRARMPAVVVKSMHASVTDLP